MSSLLSGLTEVNSPMPMSLLSKSCLGLQEPFLERPQRPEWKVTQHIFEGLLEYLYFTLSYTSTTFQREILYFLLCYIYLTAVVALFQIKPVFLCLLACVINVLLKKKAKKEISPLNFAKKSKDCRIIK